jgi:hypothetical protein
MNKMEEEYNEEQEEREEEEDLELVENPMEFGDDDVEGLIGTSPSAPENHNIHQFLHNVATADDTTKTGYLKDEEIGIAKLPTRTFKDLSLFCREVANMNYFANYFNQRSEILTSTSLSRDAKLLEVAISQNANIKKTNRAKSSNNGGWFKKKGEQSEPVEL